MAQNFPRWARYTELHAEDLASIRATTPVAYLPWGALEWHGPHLPFGLAGMTAEAIAERVAQRTGGVLLPTTWWPITALPHTDSLAVPTLIVRALFDSILGNLARAGWKVVVLISGHYAQAHELVLMDAAEDAISHHGLLTLALPPLALVDEEMLDHAALWETSQLMAVRPQLVRLDALGSEALTPHKHGVIGRDPRGTASAALGERALTMATDSIVRAVEELLETGDSAPLFALYAQRRLRYQPYVRRYCHSSYEQAMSDWWDEQP